MPNSNNMTVRDEYEKIKMNALKGADPLKYNYEMCASIQRRINQIALPKLSKDEMSLLKEHLANYQQIKNKDLRYQFLNIRNCFLIINEFEDHDEMRLKIRPVLAYLDAFKYVFDLIIESQSQKESPILDKALNVLNLDINKFCMRYSHVLTESDITAFSFTTQMQTPREDIPQLDPKPRQTAPESPKAPDPQEIDDEVDLIPHSITEPEEEQTDADPEWDEPEYVEPEEEEQ